MSERLICKELKMATLSFLGMANIAVRQVTEKYPGAMLYEGDGLSPKGPTTDVLDVTSWRFAFRTEDVCL